MNAAWPYKWTQRQEHLVDDKFYHENGEVLLAETNAAANTESKVYLVDLRQTEELAALAVTVPP